MRNTAHSSYLLIHVLFTFTPPHLVRPASRPFSGKNFGAVCSGVVRVLLYELLPPPVPLASPVLGIARPVAEQAMVSQWLR
jgi:hypothetical protein